MGHYHVMRSREKMKNEMFGKFDEVVGAVARTVKPTTGLRTFVDLFCGIGAFHLAAAHFGMECLFSCDIDAECRKAYRANFGTTPMGDISGIKAGDIPRHDLLCAGFPCQPFSIIGSRNGLSDPRGSLFLEIARIVEVHKPKAVILENVRQFTTISKGAAMRGVVETLEGFGYTVHHRILNALDFGLPHKRERIIIVATRKKLSTFPWPEKAVVMTPLADILESDPEPKHLVSGRIRRARHKAHKATVKPAIWHENKAGNVSSHPYSCALRAQASYNYLLVDGERRLTPREMLRLQGFPDTFELVCSDSQVRKQAGNAVPVPMVRAVLGKLLNVYG